MLLLLQDPGISDMICIGFIGKGCKHEIHEDAGLRQ